jgi:hypothetical protein
MNSIIEGTNGAPTKTLSFSKPSCKDVLRQSSKRAMIKLKRRGSKKGIKLCNQLFSRKMNTRQLRFLAAKTAAKKA